MINWVEDDPCDCCGSPYHLFHDCPVARRKIEAYREQQDRIIFGFKNHEGSPLLSSYHQPHSANSYGYYQPNSVYQRSSFNQKKLQYENSQQGNQRKYQRGTYNQGGYNHGYQQGSYCNYQENWQDQGNHEEGLADSDASLKDTLMEFMKEIRKDNEIQDKIRMELAKKVSKLAEEMADLKAMKNKTTQNSPITEDFTIEPGMVNDEVVDELMDFPNQEVGEEVMEINTTLILPVVKEPYVDKVVMEEDIEEEVTSHKEYVTSCVQPLTDTPPEEPVNQVTLVYSNHPPIFIIKTEKFGDDGSSGKKRKVSWEDLGKIVMKWTRNNSTDMLIMNKKMKNRYVNYRTYIGNSVGKCGFHLSRTESMDMMGKKKMIGSRNFNYRAYIGNSVGKCSLRPP